MTLSLKQELHNFLDNLNLIGQGEKSGFIVAYSGGRDSTALLHNLVLLKQEDFPDINITAAYYWHPWRPLQEDLRIVHQNCKMLGVQWFVLTPDLTLPKTEAAARSDRYRQLAKLAYDLKATAILTAHHQDDQIETILFRLFRGTGLEGITGIPAVRTINPNKNKDVMIARPFLNIPRAFIDNYIKDHQLSYVEDPTNMEVHLKRNFIRHEILPKIEAAFPQTRQSLIRLSEITKGELQIIDRKIDEIWQDLYDFQTQTLDEVRFTQLLPSFQQQLLRRFMEETGNPLEYDQIKDLLEFISGKKRDILKPALFSLSSEKFFSVYRGRFSIEKSIKTEITPLKILIPTEISHCDLKATLSIIPLKPEQIPKPVDYSKLSPYEAYVDLSRFQDKELVLRSRKTGDQIRPLGMNTTMKLKKFFINRAVPRFKRDMIPVLTEDSEVLWAVGVGISDKIRVNYRPTHLIKFERCV